MTDDIYTIFQRPEDPTDFEAVRIRIASPEKIREWSYGEVKKPETINYRTFKPEKDGLFCAKIFGPIKDWECICGKYREIQDSGVVCDKCGVEVIQSKVRRERLGHIELSSPVAHIWYLRSRPSIIGSLIDMPLKDLEKVLYFESYIVVDPGGTPLQEKELLTEDEYKKKTSEYGSRFKAGMGAEAVRELLKRIDLDGVSKQLNQGIRLTRSEIAKTKLAKRLQIIEAFRKSGNKPEWMIMDVIPVLPSDLRPLVPLEGGRFATSDLNDLYRRVINRNNRLKRLIELKAPSAIIKNEKRMLQEAVDALFDNDRRGRVLKATTNRPLKSLSDMIKGKQGRFRQNLLGKRVDYSGRSVIVPDPTLKLHQCGLPKKMALELFKPFVFNELAKKGYATTIKAAKKLIEKKSPEVWDALEKVLQEHPVLLNRHPTLHKFNIMAFDPVLVEGKALRLHPLVCGAFNADFDGDTMAIYVPLSLEAQIEARVLMSSVNNILTPANGSPVIEPTQDVVLGIYYLTKENPDNHWNGMTFADTDEVRIAYNAGVIGEHTKIKVKTDGKVIDTTTGRVLLKEILPCGFPFHLINRIIKRDDLRMIIRYLYSEFGAQDAVEFLNKLMDLGFQYATKSGLSVCMDDIVVPLWKDSIIEDARNKEKEYIREFNRKEDEDDEFHDYIGRNKKIIQLWQKASDVIYDEVIKTFEKTGSSFNSIRMMIDSGARGNWIQLSQIAGIKGFVSNPSEENMPVIITANYREGLSPLDYFQTASRMHMQSAQISKYSTDAGWLMRRLIDVAQDIVITEDDCGTLDGIDVAANKMNDIFLQSLEERITGRISAEEIRHPETGAIFLKPDEEITTIISEKLSQSGIGKVKIRSVLTCRANSGVCTKCYGRDLSTGLIADVGEAIGIIAAQSIGGPVIQSVFNMRHEYQIMPVNDTQAFLSKLLELFEARIPRDSSATNYKNILAKSGLKDALPLLLNEFQSVFRRHKIFIADKHFEVIIRKMLEKVKVEETGDTLFLKGELVQKQRFIEENANVQFEGGRPAIGRPAMLGITKASLSSDSWISAASFQEATRVLTEAAITGAVDELGGLKENVIMGRMIPAGTGMPKYRNTFVKREIFSEFNKEEKHESE
jgi:DNA-directed RNA polymerase subunit beta'